MLRYFQNRLAMKHDIIKRKIMDNGTELAGNPTDTIRIRTIKNDEGDTESQVVDCATVEDVIWPPLKDIPIRKLESVGNGSYKITSLVNVSADDSLQNFTLFFPHKSDLKVDDWIIRVFLDPDVKEPIILALKISELLGTFGQMMLINQKCNCTLITEDIPSKLVSVISEMAKRRLRINF